MCPYSLPNERKCWVWLRSSWMARGEKLAVLQILCFLILCMLKLSTVESSWPQWLHLHIFTGLQNGPNEESSCAGSGSHRGSVESGSHRSALECSQSQVALMGLHLNGNVEKETELCGNRFHLSFRCTKLLTLFIWAGNWQPAEKLQNLIPFQFLGDAHTDIPILPDYTGMSHGYCWAEKYKKRWLQRVQTAAKTTSPLCHSLCHCKLVDWQQNGKIHDR